MDDLRTILAAAGVSLPEARELAKWKMLAEGTVEHD